ncbi:hypothetical protein BC936DRAFT_144795 [Jimgerdemannia flammicorona]|uniref:Secreted protein n=1 Tax=Jimgerdemannia flammicorona TaxID=994334 RepID=A0A433DBM5_9FUNG|nr:hypothetical protein BC936DRAFT_144795 [Jimgerdemannia flammicorona]
MVLLALAISISLRKVSSALFMVPRMLEVPLSRLAMLLAPFSRIPLELLVTPLSSQLLLLELPRSALSSSARVPQGRLMRRSCR